MAETEKKPDEGSPEQPCFSRFETVELLGQGGMGTVWKVRQKDLPRTVALKVLNAGKLARTSELKRFKMEASAAAKLQHPSLVPIYEVGEEQGCCYFTMEYVEGQTLARLLRGTPLEPRRAAELLLAMAEAIHYAHSRGLLHRDLKPGNVIVDGSGRPRIMDFGLAKELYLESSLTESNAILGTPSYMSPEQAEGKIAELSPKSDVYSLGAVLYETITGRPPFRAHNLSETLRQVISDAPALPRSVNPKVPRDLETICLKCLQKEPGRRYHSAQELADELGRFLRKEPIRARPIGMPARAWRILRRNPVAAGSTSAIATLLLVMAIAAIFARQSLLTANGLLAHTTADMLQLQLEKFATLMQDVARDPALIAATQNGDKPAVQALLSATHKKVKSAQDLKWLAGEPFENWNVLDLRGNLIARTDFDPSEQRSGFQDRDYFTGALDKLNRSAVGANRVHFSKIHFSRFDPYHKFGISTVIVSGEEESRGPLGVLVAMFTPRSSAPLNDIHRKIALVGPADPSDAATAPAKPTFNYYYVLHPDFTPRTPAVGVNRLPFDPAKSVHNLYRDPVGSRFRPYQNVWLAGSAPIVFNGSPTGYYVVVQSRDWILTFITAVFGIGLVILAIVMTRREYTRWKFKRPSASAPNARLAGVLPRVSMSMPKDARLFVHLRPSQPCILERQAWRRTSVLHWHDKVLHDVVFAFGGVFAHVEAEDVLGVSFGGGFHLAQAHFFADELFEFVGRNFTETFETGDFGGSSELFRGRVALGFAVAVMGFLFVAHPEERRLQHEEMPVMHKLLEELVKISD
jgi:eukaryotic-like serine/threonine-protein kinase